MDKAITVQGLQKSYGSVHAVRGSDFYVEKGQLFALLGENGAGKSTTIDILSTLLPPDAGQVKIAGFALGRQNNEIRQSIGIVFQKSHLDDTLTVRENLMLRGSFYGMPKSVVAKTVTELAAPLGIHEFLDRRYGKLSGGQRRRADIARALINTPKVLFLDEPTTGLDPASRRAIWDIIRKMQREKGTTVLLTTHYMEEAAEADYVIVMGHGKILAKGTPPTLKDANAKDTLRIHPKNLQRFEKLLNSSGVAYRLCGGFYSFPLADTLQALPLLKQYQNHIENFEVVQGSLEEAFLHIIEVGNQGVAQ